MLKKMSLIMVAVMALVVFSGLAIAQNETITTTAAAPSSTPEQVLPVMANNTVCPVTGLTIAELGKNTVEYKGKVYNLCSPACKDEFLKDPEKYAAKVEEQAKAQQPAAPADEMK